MEEREAEWVGRAEFAEEGEALGIPTDQIFSKCWDGRMLLVLYSEEPITRRRKPDVWCASLYRNEDGILKVHEKAKAPEELQASIEYADEWEVQR